MSCQLDGYSLKIRSPDFREEAQQVGSEYDDWVDGAYHRVVFAYGKLMRWQFTCFEEVTSFPWGASPARHFMTRIQDGAQVQFALSYAGHTFSGLVYIRNIQVFYGAKMKVRYYELSIQEA